MNKATLRNLLPNAKVRLSDNQEVLLLSIFYNHPLMLSEDGWTLLKIGSENILVDKDTIQVIDKCEIELKWEKDHIVGLELTSNLKGDELKRQWDDLVEFSKQVKKEISLHFDKDKVDDLCNQMDEVKITSVSQDDETLAQTPHELEKVQTTTLQIPQENKA